MMFLKVELFVINVDKFSYGNGKIKEKAKNDQHKSPPSGATSTSITLPIVTVGKSTRISICAVCRTTGGPFVAIPEKARMTIFIKQGLIVPVGVRCCRY